MALVKKDSFIFDGEKFNKFILVLFVLDLVYLSVISNCFVHYGIFKIDSFVSVGFNFVSMKSSLRLFFFSLRNFFCGVYYWFVNEFFLDGIYYRVKYYKHFHSIGFLIGYSNYVLYRVPVGLQVRVHMKRRRFLIFGMDKMLLNTVSDFLVRFKYPNIYMGKGIKLRRYKYRVKEVIKKR